MSEEYFSDYIFIFNIESGLFEDYIVEEGAIIGSVWKKISNNFSENIKVEV